MPKGNPNTQTIATAKYQKKAGYMTKSFKLKRALVEQFVETCEIKGVSQASVISHYMKEFIQQNT